MPRTGDLVRPTEMRQPTSYAYIQCFCDWLGEADIAIQQTSQK